MTEIVLRIENLGKCFKIYHSPWDRAREWGSWRQQTYHTPFWALRGISFEVRRGEFLGIIGENGAGKSTLLKIITGILKPTEGSYQLNGRVLSLLELGRDFNFELSGRANALYSAELLGFPPGYVQSRLAEIEAFSELGDFFDRPMKLYSSGMKSRLAFSLFAFLECEVLILDEVLAVGDIFFQQKCYTRLEKLIEQQTTIILVTHQLATVQQYCNRVVLLHKGQQVFQGESRKGILRYYQLRQQAAASPSPLPEPKTVPAIEVKDFFWPTDENCVVFEEAQTDEDDAETSHAAFLTRYTLCNRTGEFTTVFEPGEQAYLCCEFELLERIEVPIVAVLITNEFNILVHGQGSHQQNAIAPDFVTPGNRVRFCRRIELNIAPGQYVLGFALCSLPPTLYACLRELPWPEINSQLRICRVYDQVGAFQLKPHSMGSGHFGLCNLPGEVKLQVIQEDAEEKSA